MYCSWQDQRRKRLSVTRLDQAGVKKAGRTPAGEEESAGATCCRIGEGLARGGGLLLAERRGPSTRRRTPVAGEERA